MKPAGLLLLPGLLLLSGCLPNEPAAGLPTVACNQLGTPPANVALRANLPPPSSIMAEKVFWVGREILAKNQNSGLDPNLTFITYPSPAVEIFHIDRTQIYVTEGLVQKCDREQLAAVLANEMGKMAAERMIASPYLDMRDVAASPIPEPIGNDQATPPSEWMKLVGYDPQRAHKKSRPEPRRLARVFLEKTYGHFSLDAAQAILEEASLHHNVELRMKGLPGEANWRP